MAKYLCNIRNYRNLELQYQNNCWMIFLEDLNNWVKLEETDASEGFLYKKKTRSYKRVDIVDNKPVFKKRDDSEDMICYNCGKKMTESESTKEHIPAQGIFEDFPESYKAHRITVLGCQKCNVEYSLHEEEFRNALGVVSDKKDSEKELIRKTQKSLIRKKARENGRLIFGKNKKLDAVVFKEKDFIKNHEKNFKALFKKKFGKVLPQDFKLAVDLMDLESKEFKNRKAVYNHLTKNFEWQYSGHPDVFKYIIQPFSEKLPDDKSDIPFTGQEDFYIAIMVYRNKFVAIIGAAKHGA